MSTYSICEICPLILLGLSLLLTVSTYVAVKSLDHHKRISGAMFFVSGITFISMTYVGLTNHSGNYSLILPTLILIATLVMSSLDFKEKV